MMRHWPLSPMAFRMQSGHIFPGVSLAPKLLFVQLRSHVQLRIYMYAVKYLY